MKITNFFTFSGTLNVILQNGMNTFDVATLFIFIFDHVIPKVIGNGLVGFLGDILAHGQIRCSYVVKESAICTNR